MKQGTLVNKIVILVLAGAVAIYLAVYAWNSLTTPFSTVLSYAYAVDDSIEATGFLVREEVVLPSAGGTVELLPAEGERVSKGEAVAVLYQNTAALERRQELQKLNPLKDTASDHMLVFVVLNSVSVQLIPTGTAVLRENYGSANPMEIMPAVWISSIASAAVGVVLAIVFCHRKRRKHLA